jgi:hypothetical protein
MRPFLRTISLVFAAGALGGLANGFVVWLAGHMGVTAALGVKIAPALTTSFLYPRIVWGGLWSFLFLLPLLKSRWFTRGLLFSLGPTVIQLFVIYPYKTHKGLMGIDLGLWTPLFVVTFNIIWGIIAALWLRWTGR